MDISIHRLNQTRLLENLLLNQQERKECTGKIYVYLKKIKHCFRILRILRIVNLIVVFGVTRGHDPVRISWTYWLYDLCTFFGKRDTPKSKIYLSKSISAVQILPNPLKSLQSTSGKRIKTIWTLPSNGLVLIVQAVRHFIYFTNLTSMPF